MTMKLIARNGTYDFNLSSSKACTVILLWNTEEKSNMPYLEALSLKALNWNP